MKYTQLNIEGKLLDISEDGTHVFDSNTNEELTIRRNPQGYTVVSVHGVDRLVHRLVARAWLGAPTEDGNVVNHKDNDRFYNNHYSNLEWGSYSDNNNHAYENGLRSDNREVRIKNLKTDVITDHHSLHAAGRYLNCGANSIHNYLKDTNKVRRGHYLVINKGDSWPNLGIGDIVEVKPNNRKSPKRGIRKPSRISAMHTYTGDTREWESLQDFADSHGVVKQSVEKAIYVNGGKHTNCGRWRDYQITYLNKSIANND